MSVSKQNMSPETRAKISAASTGMINALNIETQEVKRIPKELYHSRRDIYFNPNSKVYKEWKTSQGGV